MDCTRSLCASLAADHGVAVGVSWGSLTADQIKLWGTVSLVFSRGCTLALARSRLGLRTCVCQPRAARLDASCSGMGAAGGSALHASCSGMCARVCTMCFATAVQMRSVDVAVRIRIHA